MATDKRTGFTFYRSYYEQLQIITEPLQRLAMYDALADYALNHTKPDLESGNYNELQKMFWTGVLPLLDKSWQLFDNGTHGGAPKGNTNASKGKTTKKQPKDNQKQPTTSKDDYKDVYKDYNKDNYNNIEGEREDDVFRPPSLEEVLFYCSSIHGADGDGQAKKFFNYYAARGWKMSNGATMADWRAAFDSWCNREKEFNHIHTCNNENDKPTSEQRGTGFRQLQEQPNRETGLNGQGAGIDDAVW